MINRPEKNSNPRIIKVSEKCIEMIMRLPRKRENIFGRKDAMTSDFYKQRRKIAAKISNPRLLEVKFHTFRHWKATTEYHRTKDIVYVKDLLRHRNIQNTMIYITIERAVFQSSAQDGFTVKVAQTLDEAVSARAKQFDGSETWVLIVERYLGRSFNGYGRRQGAGWDIARHKLR